jgi:beta-N-acetylhexosaminidase
LSVWAAGVATLAVLPLPGGALIHDDRASSRTTAASQAAVRGAPTCRPAPLTARAAAVLVAGLPDTLGPDDPLVSTLPKLGVGGVILTARNVTSADQVRALTSALRRRSPRPLLVTTDEEGGQVSSFRSLLGPTSPAASVGGDSAGALFDQGQQLGTQLRRFGVTGDLAPVADLASGGNSAIGDRSYSSAPVTATTDVLAVARGLAAGGVVPAVKHFPGLGRPSDDTHREMAVVTASRSELERTDLAPFVQAIRAGVPIVMVSHAAFPSLGISGQPASLSPATYALLRSLGFTGVAMTDSLGMGAVNLRHDYPDAAVQALAAGADALLFTDGTQAKRMRDAIVSAVQNHRLSGARLNEAAARMVALTGGDPHALTCQDVTLPTLH